MSNLIESSNLEAMLAARSKILELMAESFRRVAEADKLLKQYGYGLRSEVTDFGRYYGWDTERHHIKVVDNVDELLWEYLIKKSGIKTLMDSETRRLFDNQMSTTKREGERYGKSYRPELFTLHSSAKTLLMKSISW